MDKSNLIEMFNAAIEGKFNYVAVAVKMPTCPYPEIIVNPIENAPAKLNYYKNTYDDELRLKACPDIHIVGINYDRSIQDTVMDLLEATYE